MVKWGENTNLLQGAASSLAATAAGNAQKDLSGNASGTTKSAIAEGTIRINDDAGQLALTGKSVDETLATLNRDTEGANQSIEKIFDAEKVREQQELNRLKSEVAQQAAPLIYNKVGDVLVGSSPATKAAVHALVGGLMAEAIGGSFAAGAAGGAAATLAMEAFGQSLLDQKDLSESDRKALVQLAGTIVGGAAGGAAGGSGSDAAAGANVGKVATENNYLNHVDREAFEKAQAACGPGNPKACAEAEIYAEQDRKNDLNLANAVNRCEPGEPCDGVASFILDQMQAAGCATNASSAECNKLGNAWVAARLKAQGLETPLISPDDLVPLKGISSLAAMGIRGGAAALAKAGLLGGVKNAEVEAAETVGKWAAKKPQPSDVSGASGASRGADNSAVASAQPHKKLFDGNQGEQFERFALHENRAAKIFGSRSGHLPDNPENRALLMRVANDPKAILGSDKFGTVWSAKLQPDGSQVWVQTRNGQVWNGGVNKTPLPYNAITGLASPTRPGWK